MLELSMENLRDSDRNSEGFAAFLNHDLSMLRLIEAFAESAPQLILMLTIILQQSQFDPVTGRVNTTVKDCRQLTCKSYFVIQFQDSVEGFTYTDLLIKKIYILNLNIHLIYIIYTCMHHICKINV